MWEQGRDNGKGDYLKGPLAPSININQSEMHGCVNDSLEPARVRVCVRRATKGKKTKDKYIYMKLGGSLFVFCVAFMCFSVLKIAS